MTAGCHGEAVHGKGEQFSTGIALGPGSGSRVAQVVGRTGEVTRDQRHQSADEQQVGAFRRELLQFDEIGRLGQQGVARGQVSLQQRDQRAQAQGRGAFTSGFAGCAQCQLEPVAGLRVDTRMPQ